MDSDALVTLTVRKRHLGWIVSAFMGLVPGSGILTGWMASDDGEAAAKVAQQMKAEHIARVCVAHGFVDPTPVHEIGPPSLVAFDQ